MDSAGILQHYLDEVSSATLKADWETYREAITLPCAVISHNESKIITTDDDLRAGFDSFTSTLHALKVTDYIRLVEHATRLDHDLISGSYISHLIAGGQRVLAPYRSIMTLRLVGNRWKAASVTNGLANSRWPLIRLELPEGK
jgi:hypothetical protein